jgi:hypothetical protein
VEKIIARCSNHLRDELIDRMLLDKSEKKYIDVSNAYRIVRSTEHDHVQMSQLLAGFALALSIF